MSRLSEYFTDTSTNASVAFRAFAPPCLSKWSENARKRRENGRSKLCIKQTRIL